MRSATPEYVSLGLSSDLNGKIKVCCHCPSVKVSALAQVQAFLFSSTGAPRAQAFFDYAINVFATPTNPKATKAGSVLKTLDPSTYCATFEFVLGQVWQDFSRKRETSSSVMIKATFDCWE